MLFNSCLSCAVIRGRLDTTALASFARLQFMSGAVQPVLATPDGTLLVGPARVTVPNLPARNGAVHIVSSVLSPDASTNSTSVAVAEKMGDFGPFNWTKVWCFASCVWQLDKFVPPWLSKYLQGASLELSNSLLGQLSLYGATGGRGLSDANLLLNYCLLYPESFHLRVKALDNHKAHWVSFCCLQREQMFTYEITFLPTSLPSLPSSYRRVRMVVGYPDGGVKNPMALSFVPRAALEAGRATQKLPASATSQGSWLQQPQPPPATRPASDVDLCFMTVCAYISPWRLSLIIMTALVLTIKVLERGLLAVLQGII